MTDVTLPRPDKTTFALMLLKDSSDADARALAMLDITGAALEKWTPGNDLCIIIREPTDRETLLMQVTPGA